VNHNKQHYREEYKVIKEADHRQYPSQTYNGQHSVQAPLAIDAVMAQPTGADGQVSLQQDLSPSPDSTTKDIDGVPSTSSNMNVKEKTPMCLVNELARFNKVRVTTLSFSSYHSKNLINFRN